MPLDILAVDDEPHALANLRHLLLREPDVRDCVVCDGGAAAVARIGAHRPDLVFLDVQMPEVDGFEVVRRVGLERMPPVVFVTAHDAWAVRAFEVNAVDYLLKPVADDRFAVALRRARGRMAASAAAALSQRLAALLGHVAAPAAEVEPAAGGPALVLRDGGQTVVVRPEEIDWVSAEDYCVQIHAGGRAHLVRGSLAALAERLDERRFIRVHRSALVNVDRVRDIRTMPSGRIVVGLRGGQSVPVARARVAALQALIGAGR
jgi:two-component system LytT family response regulator